MKKINGLMTALITPFSENGEIDFASLEKLVKQQLDGGVDGLVISGTTAESPNLSTDEVKEIFKFIKALVPTDFLLVLGAGTNSTSGTIEKIKGFESLDPDGYLIVVPYYNKPSQVGMLAHFKAVAASTDKNIVLYDIPGRSVVEMSVNTIVELSNINNIVGIKDATGKLDKLKKVLNRSDLKEGFIFLSGDDGSTCEFIKLGGHGAISVLSHVIPEEFKKCMFHGGDFARYSKLADLLFAEPNPTPAKHALKKMGVIESDQLRLPLLKIQSSDLLIEELKSLELI